jgi:cell division protein FtsB
MSARAPAARGYRMRPAPRRRGRRRSPGRINWDKVGRVALVIVLVGVIASYIGPSLNFIDAWRDSRAEQTNLAEAKRENERLRSRIAILGEQDAAERAARRTGMVAAGEAPYAVKGLGR